MIFGKQNGQLSLKRLPIFMKITEGEIFEGKLIVLHRIFLSTMKKRTIQILFHISIKVEVIRLVRVKAYKRFRFGKVERVRSHYRKY